MQRFTLIDEFLIRLLYVIAAAIVVMQLLGQENMVSAFFALSFLPVLALWLTGAVVKIDKTDFLIFFTILLAFLCVFLNFLLTDGKMSFGYFRKLIFFSASLIYFQTASKLQISEGAKTFIRLIITSISLLFVIFFFWKENEMHMMNHRVSAYLTFRFTNPNLTALFLSCLYMLETAQLFRARQTLMKILHLVLAAFLFYFILETGARNAQLIILIYTASVLLLKLIPTKQMKIRKLFSIILAMLPAIFLVLYMVLIQNQWIMELFSFMVSEGKELSSRYEMWSNGLTLYAQSPFIGSYGQISSVTGGMQLHNTHLDVLVSYGPVVWLLFSSLLSRFINRNDKVYESKYEFAYQLGFVCALSLGFGEAAIFSGGLGIYLFVGLFLLLASESNDLGGFRLEFDLRR